MSIQNWELIITQTYSNLERATPNNRSGLLSPIEIEGIADVTNSSTLEVLTKLKDAGMHGLPGGGAEMLVEESKNRCFTKKGSPDNWLRVMKEANLLD